MSLGCCYFLTNRQISKHVKRTCLPQLIIETQHQLISFQVILFQLICMNRIGIVDCWKTTSLDYATARQQHCVDARRRHHCDSRLSNKKPTGFGRLKHRRPHRRRSTTQRAHIWQQKKWLSAEWTRRIPHVPKSLRDFQTRFSSLFFSTMRFMSRNCIFDLDSVDHLIYNNGFMVDRRALAFVCLARLCEWWRLTKRTNELKLV